MEQYHDEEGVSEMTSTALLIGVTILLVAILTAIFLSGLQPDEIPRAAIYARNESGKFALAHMGGDPLEEGNYRIYIDTGGGLVNATGDFTRPGGGVWSVGESIAYDGTWIPGRVVVTVISGRTEMILAEMGLPGGIGIPTPTETATPTPTETVTPTPTETVTPTPT
ncbi:MAG: type IV pilin N-terminal domain-containing protein, partial [Methanoculleus sp.]